MAKAMLQSRDRDGRHQVPLENVEILEEVGNNDYIVRTPDGIRCHALFNPFTGFYFADDVYRVVPEQDEQDADGQDDQDAGEQNEQNDQDADGQDEQDEQDADGQDDQDADEQNEQDADEQNEQNEQDAGEQNEQDEQNGQDADEQDEQKERKL